MLGEITTFLPKIDIPLGVDAIYLDGFSPSKNPQIWSEKIMFGLKRISKKKKEVVFLTTGTSLTLNEGFSQ